MDNNDKHFFKMLDNIEYKYDINISSGAWDLLDMMLLDTKINFFDINSEWLEAKLLQESGYELELCPYAGPNKDWRK